MIKKVFSAVAAFPILVSFIFAQLPSLPTAVIEIKAPVRGGVAVHPQDIKAKVDIFRQTFLIPVEGMTVENITSKFGDRVHPFTGKVKYHEGVDFNHDLKGKPVKAVMDGIAHYKKNPGGYGYYVYIDHGNGLYSLYAHLKEDKEFIRLLNKTKEVTAGQDIPGCYVGNSGGRSTGPHLHLGIYQVRENMTWKDISKKPRNPWYAVNPGAYLDPANAGDYVSGKGAYPRNAISSFIDGEELKGSYVTLSAGEVLNIDYTSPTQWDLLKSRVQVGDHQITVKVFDLVFLNRKKIGEETITAIVEPPKVIDYGPQGDITQKILIIKAKIFSPSKIPINWIKVYLDGTELDRYEKGEENLTAVGISVSPNNSLSEGKHNVKLCVEDVNGNEKTIEWNFKIISEISKVYITKSTFKKNYIYIFATGQNPWYTIEGYIKPYDSKKMEVTAAQKDEISISLRKLAVTEEGNFSFTTSCAWGFSGSVYRIDIFDVEKRRRYSYYGEAVEGKVARMSCSYRYINDYWYKGYRTSLLISCASFKKLRVTKIEPSGYKIHPFFNNDSRCYVYWESREDKKFPVTVSFESFDGAKRTVSITVP